MDKKLLANMLRERLDIPADVSDEDILRIAGKSLCAAQCELGLALRCFYAVVNDEVIKPIKNIVRL